MRILPAGFTAWPDDAVNLTTEKVIEMYTTGRFAAAFMDPEARAEADEVMRSRGMNPDGAAVAHEYGFAGSGAGKLTLLFPFVTAVYGYEAFTFPGQKTGDCVSMQQRDVALHLVCIDAATGIPDEVTGKVEQPPEVSDTARKNGVFANEPYYRYRGHSRQGMSCDVALKWAMTTGGIIVRQKYPDVDLEAYNVSWEVPGSSGVPDWLNTLGKQHNIRNASRPQDHEQARDFMAIGCPIGICSSLGFSSSRDQNGYSRRSGSWAHSWHLAGYDDRAETKQIYGFPLALFGHRWGKWNSGPRRIRGTTIDIPEGYAWIDARLLDQCWMSACNSVAGWPARKLPTYGMGIWG